MAVHAARPSTRAGAVSRIAVGLELDVVGIPTSVVLNGGGSEATGRAKSTGGILHTNQHGGVRRFYLPRYRHQLFSIVAVIVSPLNLMPCVRRSFASFSRPAAKLRFLFFDNSRS